jgi:hypothetical protein
MIFSLLTVSAAVVVAVADVTRRDDTGPQNPGLSIASGVNRVWISNSCSATEKATAKQAFSEGKSLTNAFNSWNPGADHQDVMDIYMGMAFPVIFS